MKLKGKVKSIPVTEVTEEMQVIYNDGNKDYVMTVGEDEKHPISLKLGVGHARLSHLKTFVIEYKEKVLEDELEAKEFVLRENTYTKQLPLKYSQWQSALDNGEVDSDKEVEFEIITNDTSNYNVIPQNFIKHIQFAKIIPVKKRMYSEEDMIKFTNWCVQFHKDITKSYRLAGVLWEDQDKIQYETEQLLEIYNTRYK